MRHIYVYVRVILADLSLFVCEGSLRCYDRLCEPYIHDLGILCQFLEQRPHQMIDVKK